MAINELARALAMVSTADFNWKIICGGAGGVGKTTFLFRYLTNQFVANTSLTVGVQLHSQTIERQGKKIGLIIWDLGGQERFRFLQDSYMKGASAGIVFFDISNLGSLLQVKDWVAMFRKFASPSIPILLVGTKLDIAEEQMHLQSEKEALVLVKQLDLIGYLPSSSKLGKNIEAVIYTVVDLLVVQKLSGRQAGTIGGITN
nr:Rab family GTPase [Candidatus Sigynarchaeota archaeon]